MCFKNDTRMTNSVLKIASLICLQNKRLFEKQQLFGDLLRCLIVAHHLFTKW